MDDNQLWKMAKARVEFKHHLRTYLYVNGLLWIIYLIVNNLTSRESWGFPWPIYPGLFWGIAIAIHFYKTYWRSPIDPVKREYDKLKRKQENNQDKH